MRLKKAFEDKNCSNIIHDLKTNCSFCSTLMNEGGFWFGGDNVLLCRDCSTRAVDLLIDTLDDTTAFGELNHQRRLEILTDICESRLQKKNLVNKGLKNLTEEETKESSRLSKENIHFSTTDFKD